MSETSSKNYGPNIHNITEAPVRGGETPSETKPAETAALPFEATALTQPPEQEPGKKKANKGLKITAWVLGGSLVLGGGAKLGYDYLAGLNSDQAQGGSGQGGGNTGGEGTGSNTGELVPVYQFEADPLTIEQYPDAATLVPAFFNENTEWINVGGNFDNQQSWLGSNEGAEFVDVLLAESDESYTDDLVVDEFASNEGLANWVARQAETHFNTLQINFLTTPGHELSNPADKQAYVRTMTVTGVKPISQSANEIVAKVTIVESDNSDQNRAVELTGGVEVDSTPQTVVMTWTNVDGQWKLSNFAG